MQEEDCSEVSRVVCTSFQWVADREGVTRERLNYYLSERGSEDAIRSQFQEYQCLVACAGQTIVGMVAVKGNEVTKLYVEPQFHRQGIGTMLFNAAQRIIMRAGHKEMVLGTAFDSSIPFYEAMGMSIVGRKEGANTVLMETSLLPHLRNKVFAYITHAERLLVFSHPDFPEAGIQVPAGTQEEDECPEEGVMREAFEETGLKNLKLNTFLGEYDHEACERDELHRRRFYHIICGGQPLERWQHQETDPGDGSTEPITFEFFWVILPDGVPKLATGHDKMLPKLLDVLQKEM